MRRVFLPLIVVVLLALSAPVFAEIELGASFTPAEYMMSAEIQQLEKFLGAEDVFEAIFGFHIGYSWWWLFYGSWDAMVMPPWWVYSITVGEEASGIYRPAFLNLFDVGVRPTLGPIMLLAEAGINNIRIYGQEGLGVEGAGEANFGVNLRLGAGLMFDSWSITVTGTSVYNTFDKMVQVIKGVTESNPNAIRYLVSSLIPSITFNMHL